VERHANANQSRARRAAAWVLLMLALATLTGCVANGPKSAIGGVGGATAGGLIGAAAGGGAEGIIAGALLGGLLGGAVGDALDQRDRTYAMRSAHESLEWGPSGSTASWHNPDSGNYGSVTPIRTYEPRRGEYCREYQQSVTVDGWTERAYGTACRQPDGSWRILQ